MRMRQALLLMTFLGAVTVAVVATLTSIASAQSTPWTKCGPKFTFLVWPHGHPALAKIQFPEIRKPHIEAYIDFGNTWPDTRAGAYVIGGKPPASIGSGDSLGPCLNYGDSLSSGAVADGVTIRTQTAVQCTFRTAGVIDIVERPGKVQIMLFHAGKKIYARAVATPTTASLTVPKSCRKVHSPG